MSMKEDFFNVDKTETERMAAEAETAYNKENAKEVGLQCAAVWLWDILILPLFKILKDFCSPLR